jgi:hypothetical protein
MHVRLTKRARKILDNPQSAKALSDAINNNREALWMGESIKIEGTKYSVSMTTRMSKNKDHDKS